MLLKGLETRFSDPSKLAKFMQWKETEVLKSLLDENVEIRLIDGTNSSAKTYLKTIIKIGYIMVKWYLLKLMVRIY